MKKLRREEIRGLYDYTYCSSLEFENKVIAIIDKHIKEVIGEDEEYNKNACTATEVRINERLHIKNQLRAEQRARSNQIMPKE